tara:strand:+ start:476 stop:706 length:231 start_codon:yes stop_codon:yes gene_type:complete
MDETISFFKALMRKLLNEAFTTVLLVLISYYFLNEERKTKTELIELYKEDRRELMETLDKRNQQIFNLYEKINEKK